MNIDQPLTLTVEQAARLLGIGRSTAYELVHTGDIPSLRLGRRIVVPVGKIAERLGIPIDLVSAKAASPDAGDTTAPASSTSRSAQLDAPASCEPPRTLF